MEALTAGDEAVLDARGTVCPQPVIDLARWWRAHPQRERVRLLADDEAARVDVPAWCRMTGHELHAVTELPEGAPHTTSAHASRPDGSSSARASRRR